MFSNAKSESCKYTSSIVHAPLSLVGFASAVAFCARIQLVLLADNVFFKLAGSKRGLNPPSYATQIQRLLLLYDCVRLPAMASLSIYTFVRQRFDLLRN